MRTASMLRWLSLLSSVAMLYCSDPTNGNTGFDTDSNTSTDSNTDTGADTHGDTDTETVTDTGTDTDTDSETTGDTDSGAVPRIDGFFVQPSLGYGATSFDRFSSQQEYTDWVQTMKDAGATMLFYQWTMHYWHNQTWFSDAYGEPSSADFAFYDTTLEPLEGIAARAWVTPTSWPGAPSTGGKEPVEYLLDAGQAAGVEIWLGLYLCEDDNAFNWWQAVADTDLTEEDVAIIDYHMARSVEVVDELYEKYGDHPALGGFYYSVEVENVAFIPDTNTTLLAALLDYVADAVHAHDPQLRLAISPFFNTALSTPEEFGAMWHYALSNSDIDVVILQDGAGVDPFTLTDNTDLISPFFEAMAGAASASGKELWGNAELFTNLGTRLAPQFVPGSIAQLERQLTAEAPFVEKFVCFGFQYMDPHDDYVLTPPMGGDAATDATLRQTLYDDYRGYLETLKK